MTINEAIVHAREVAIEKSSIATELSLAGMDAIECIKCKQEHEQLAEWLEELKSIKDGSIPIIHGREELKFHDREIRNKAVDDFANRLYSKIKSEIDDCADELEWIDEIAKQLKAGDCD